MSKLSPTARAAGFPDKLCLDLDYDDSRYLRAALYAQEPAYAGIA